MSVYEDKVVEEWLARGAVVLRRGWPDLAIRHEGEVFFVEVKASGDSLRPSQIAMHDLLGELGMPVRVQYEPGWTPGAKNTRERIGKRLYQRTRVDGSVVYEVNVRNANGHCVMQLVGPDLDEAILLRDRSEVASRLKS